MSHARRLVIFALGLFAGGGLLSSAELDLDAAGVGRFRVLAGANDRLAKAKHAVATVCRRDLATTHFR